MITVAVDAMGGDYAPSQMVAGAIAAVNLRKDIKVVLVGRREMWKGNCPERTIQRIRLRLSTLLR